MFKVIYLQLANLMDGNVHKYFFLSGHLIRKELKI